MFTPIPSMHPTYVQAPPGRIYEEVLQAHGGSRVDNAQVCVVCHNPNLSSSGRTVDASLTAPAEKEKLAAAGCQTKLVEHGHFKKVLKPKAQRDGKKAAKKG